MNHFIFFIKNMENCHFNMIFYYFCLIILTISKFLYTMSTKNETPPMVRVEKRVYR